MSRLAPTREFYIPKGAIKITPKDGGAVFYIYIDDLGRPCARCFVGRAQKPTWSYRFANEAKRAAAIKTQIEETTARAAYMAKRKADQNKAHNWEIGLILSCSWGYDQTNVDFYEVTAVVGKCFVEIEKIGCQTATDANTGCGMSNYVVPAHTVRLGEKRRVKVSGGNHVTLASYASAHVWDGKPKYNSWYA